MKYSRAIAIIIIGLSAAGCAHHDHIQHEEDHTTHQAMMKEGDHSAHQAMMKDQTSYQHSLKAYKVPDVTLIDQHGQEQNLPVFLEASEPYALNFIFTTCTTICPIMTATFSQLDRQLGSEANNLRMISISIDPEYDTPNKLKDYIERFQMGDNFTFLTGDLETIIAVEKAFDSYSPDKMKHRPATIFKQAGTSDWVRIDGLASGADLAAEYQQLIHK